MNLKRNISFQLEKRKKNGVLIEENVSNPMRIDTIYPKHELLSTHIGRNTFICKALSVGIPPNVVMKWTGHSDYKAMKPYIDIADSIKVNSMALFDL